MKKLLFCIVVFIFSAVIQVSAAETEVNIENFTSVDNWSGSSSTSSALSVNTEEEYIKNGETSLKLNYPVSSSGSTFNITHTDWKNGGLTVPDGDSDMIVSKIGVWLYMSEADDNIEMYIRTKNTNTSKIIDSDKYLLDFSGWKYLTFDVDSTTNYIYSIVVRRVEKKENIVEKNIYLDSINAIYTYDPQYKEELDVSTDIADGANRVSPDISKIVCEFANPIEDAEEPFRVVFEPFIDCEVKKITAKQYEIVLKDSFTANSAYTMSLLGISDIYGQTLDKTINFSTSYFKLQINEIKNNDNIINNAGDIRSGNMDISLEMQGYGKLLDGKNAWMFCSVFDRNNKMIGLKVKQIILSNKVINDSISFDVTGEGQKISLFILDSLSERNIIESVEMVGEAND